MQVFDLRGGSYWKGSKKVRRDKTEAAKMLPGPVCTVPSWSSEPGCWGDSADYMGLRANPARGMERTAYLCAFGLGLPASLLLGPGRKQLGGK